MSSRRNWLKQRVRLLIAACGGLIEAEAACAAECRAYSSKQLSRCQNVRAPDMMPIDIVLCLEAYCGQPMVSRAMAEARPSTGTAGELRDEASEVTETGAELQRSIREALADGEIDPKEAAALLDTVQTAKSHLDDVEACLIPLVKRGDA